MHAYRVDVVSTPMCTGLTVNLISAKKKLGLHVKLIFLSFTKKIFNLPVDFSDETWIVCNKLVICLPQKKQIWINKYSCS